jgi:hypothetical protein
MKFHPLIQKDTIKLSSHPPLPGTLSTRCPAGTANPAVSFSISVSTASRTVTFYSAGNISHTAAIIVHLSGETFAE